MRSWTLPSAPAKMSARATVVRVMRSAEAHHGDENDERGEEREGDQAPADRVGRGGVGEERKGRALVGPVGDAQKVRDDGNGAADGDARAIPSVLVSRSSKMMTRRR